MPEIPQWLAQGGVLNITADVISIGLACRYLWKYRAKIYGIVRRAPKPVVVSLEPLELRAKTGGISIVTGNLSITAGSKVTATGRVRSSSIAERVLDQGLDVLSLMPWYR